MPIQINLQSGKGNFPNRVMLCTSIDSLPLGLLSTAEMTYVERQLGLKSDLITLNRYDGLLWIVFAKAEEPLGKRLENCRKNGARICNEANQHRVEEIAIADVEGMYGEALALAEGMALGNYQFLKYRKDKDEKQNSLNSIQMFSDAIENKAIESLSIAVEAVYLARDLVNEPVNKLNAAKLASLISEAVRGAGGKAEVFNKNKLEALKMGGLLSVNLGSVDPPTFTILEWKPKNAKNKKPVILVGKGVVYDTGGLSLKPTKSMDTMKCDMAGSAVVSAVLFAVAKAGLPLHIMALVPATDNRPGGNAYVPGDVITMYDGTSVEVLNTDAEGRLILADALAYAKKFNPELVINLATLTGSAAHAIGSQGIVVMATKADEAYAALEEQGDLVHERIVRFPLWDEYSEMLKSEIADLKNIGGPEAGAITAGKFLEHFTDYPFIHMDIAGPAYIERRDSYRGIGGTAYGVRLLLAYFNSLAKA